MGQVLAAVAIVLLGVALLLAYLMPTRLFPRWLQAEIAAGATPGPVYDGWDAAFVWLLSAMVGIGFVLFVFLAISKGLPIQ
ncbi:MAG TPA: hypothetical protein VF494_05265 [Candidatus Limnocylindrales bacterium]